MCILFLAINQHSDYPVIICANRDEFYARPTRAAQFWSEQPELLAGKDLQAGGSWLGINSKGYFAAITNIRTGIKQPQHKKSRGELVTKALQFDTPINAEWLIKHSDQYSPFNLTYGYLNQLSCYNSLQKQQTVLSDGFHAISNGAIDDIWPKMAKGQRQLVELVNTSFKSSVNSLSLQLFSILKDNSQAQDSELPDTGIPVEWERKLSSIFINTPKYGTRSSNVIAFDKNKVINFYEREYNEQGKVNNESEFKLSVS